MESQDVDDSTQKVEEWLLDWKPPVPKKGKRSRPPTLVFNETTTAAAAAAEPVPPTPAPNSVPQPQMVMYTPQTPVVPSSQAMMMMYPPPQPPPSLPTASVSWSTSGYAPRKRYDEDKETVHPFIYPLGERNDREVIVFKDGIIIRSRTDPTKYVEIDLCRWGWLRNHLNQIDEEAKQLNRQTRKVSYRQSIGGAVFCSVNSAIFCVDFRRFYVPYGLAHVPGTERPSRYGISLRLDEWQSFLRLTRVLESRYPSLADAKACYERDDHGGFDQLACPYCHPYDSTHELLA